MTEMTERTAAAIMGLMVLVATVAATPAAGLALQTESTNNSSGGQLGSAVSSFMQASAADTEGQVDTGMWLAGFERAESDARPAMVEARANVLEERLERLHQQRDELLNASDGEITVRERAKAARLAARTAALREAINATDSAAMSVGLDIDRLEVLRTEAKNLTGPEVAALARNLTTGPGTPPGAGLGAEGNANNPNGDSVGQDADQSDKGADASNQSADGGNEGPPDQSSSQGR